MECQTSRVREAALIESRDRTPAGLQSLPGTLLSTVSRLARAVALSLDPGGLLDEAIDAACRVSGADRALLILGSAADHVVVASRAVRGSGGKSIPCPWVVREAFASPVPVLASEHPVTGGTSWILGIPLPGGSAPAPAGNVSPTGVLYLDSAIRLVRPSTEQEALLSALGTLSLAAIDRRGGPRDGGSAPPMDCRSISKGDAEGPETGADRLAGGSAATADLRRLVRRVARTNLPVLITGESGTGKEVVARALHEERGGDGPFVPENCAAIPEHLFESLFFGHVRGAFTGADASHQGLFRAAENGSLFLDEIGELPGSVQAKFLRVLQEREVRPLGGCRSAPVRARILAATNRPLGSLVDAGRFRQDLYFRIRGLTIELPPLRRRPEDIPGLVDRFLVRSARRGLAVSVTSGALDALRGHDWPGNVRELFNELERAAAFADGGVITSRCLSPSLGGGGFGRTAVRPVEAEMIERALVASGGSISRAAREIGWNRQKLYRRMELLGIRRGLGRGSG